MGAWGSCWSGNAPIRGLLGLLIWIGAALAPVTAMAAGPAIVWDATEDKVLYAENPDMLWHPASLTKLMTAYIVFEELAAGKLALDDKCVNSELARREQPSKIGLPLGAKMSVDKALDALIIKSANDVAVMLAEKVSGSVYKFGLRMTETARRLGMTRSFFVNPNGLPDRRQVTTARDMALLARAIITQFPQHADRFTKSEMRLGRLRLRSHNSLLRTFEGADGLKTGFICASGFNVVASATRNGRRLVAVVLGSRSSGARNLRAQDLLTYGFDVAAWRAVLPTPSLDGLAFDPAEPGSPRDIRAKVRSRACGYRPRRAKLRRTAVRQQATSASSQRRRRVSTAERQSAFSSR